MEDPVENRNLRLDRLTSFHPKVPENTSPDVENKFVMKSRNNSNDKSTTNPILNKIDDVYLVTLTFHEPLHSL